MLNAFLLLFLNFPLHASEEIPKITLRYMERPPFVVAEGKTITGNTATPALEAFAQARIPIQIVDTPTSRQLVIISANKGYDCGIGWFKNPEREKFALFSESIYQDGPWIIVANKEHFSPTEKDLKTLFAKKNLKLITRLNFSYGTYLDSALDDNKPTLITFEGTPSQMLQIVHSGRVDYTFMSEEEYQYLLQKNSWHPDDFLALHFPEIPAGEKRYIMCSKKTPAHVIKLLNQAIKRKLTPAL